MSFQSKTLREQAQTLANEGQSMLRNGGLVNTEQRMKFDSIMEDAEKKINEARKLEDQESRSRFVAEAAEREKFQALESPAMSEYRTAFCKFLKKGPSGLNGEERRLILEKRTDDQASSMWGNVTGQTYSGTSGTQGGVFVPASFQYEVEVATKYFAPMVSDGVCRVIRTATGAVMPFPTSNDTNQSAQILADATQETEQSVPVAVVNFGAFKYSSKIVRISVELAQDSAFNLEDFLKQAFAVRFGRGYERDFTVGNGSGQPYGILNATIASGVTPVIGVGASPNDGVSATSGTTNIGTNDLVALEHSVDPSYRRGGKFMLHDQTLKVIKQLLDKYGRPVWLPGLASNSPNTILGYEYVVNQSMPSLASSQASKNSVLFGDLSKYVIRIVRDMNVLRLDERYADFGQIGFLAFSRADGNLVDAGTHPIGYLQQHS